MDNGYIIELSGWEAFFQAIENHWFTALLVFVALCFIISIYCLVFHCKCFIPNNQYNTKRKGEITMAFIKNNTNKVGKWVTTTKEHSALIGTLTVGSRVKIVDIDPVRGYSIEDKHGNRIIEIGWII